MITYSKQRKLNLELETARASAADLNTRISNDDAVAYSDLNSVPGSLYQVFYQATAPDDTPVNCVSYVINEGDYWIDSDTNKIHKYISSTWTDIQDLDIVNVKAKTDIGFDTNGNLISSVLPGVNVTPSGDGLYMGDDYLGYYASGTWQTYMDNSGNFYLGGVSGKLQWNGSVLAIDGSIDVTGISTIKQLLQINALGTLRTNTTGSYPYLELSNSGLQLKTSDTGGSYGTAIYGTDKYGFGAVVWLMNAHYQIPWMEVKEPQDTSSNDMPSIRFFNRLADPTGGSYQTGDLCVVNGILKIYNSGSWVVVGSQT